MYLDANFFIFAKFSEKQKGIRAREILQSITMGERALTSVLAIDEVMWVLRKEGWQEAMRPFVEEIYTVKNLEVREVPALVPLRALDVMEAHNLRPRDAFHVAIMEEFGINHIVTDDADFDRVKGIKRVAL